MGVVTAASLILTEQCNLKCSYCFQNDARCSGYKDSMTPEVVKDSIAWLFENARTNAVNHVDIILFGGEPFLRPDLCEVALETGLFYQKDLDIHFSANVVTNVTQMNKDIEYLCLKYTRKMKFTCQASVDGHKQAQDLYRLRADGESSWPAIEKNIEFLKYIFGHNLMVHGCVNKQTMPMLYDSYRFFYDQWGIRNLWFMPIHTDDWGPEDAVIYDEQLGLIYQHMIENKSLDVFSPISKCLAGIGNHPEKMCGAGVNFLSIDPKGNLYPCHNIYFRDPGKTQLVGNIYEGVTNPGILKPYEDYNAQTLGCGDCPNVTCYRCIADNWAENGDINAQVGKPNRCRLSAVEFKYQKLAREYAEKHFIPQDLQEANVRRTMVSGLNGVIQDMAEVKKSLMFLVGKAYESEIEEATKKLKAQEE